MTRAAMAGILAVLLGLAACGEPENGAPAVPQADATVPAPVQAVAEALFAATCGGLNGTPDICACVRDRVVTAAGFEGLAYIGAAFGADPSAAAPYEAAMSQAERNVAAEAFLDGQFDCVIASDPDYGGAPAADPFATRDPIAPVIPQIPGAAAPGPAGESPFETAVSVCVDLGAAGEPECRCRVETVFDALGEDGVRLIAAADLGDEETLRTLAESRGVDWLEQARADLEEARAACAP